VVEAQFGDSIRAVAGEMLDQFGLDNVCLRIDDRGALECVLRARIETAILRAKGEN
jgi:citrate lyase subunit gamma (acyl carrier protein)